MRIKINSGRSVMFLAVFILKSQFDKMIQWIKTKTRVNITVDSKYLTLTNNTHKVITIQSFEQRMKKKFNVDLQRVKNKDMKDIKDICKWSMHGYNSEKPFKKEEDCQRQMDKFIEMLSKGKKMGPYQCNIGQVRIAQDVSSSSPYKQYRFAQCGSFHRSRDHVCNEHELMEMIVKDNKNFYEVVRDEKRRHYFDVEWMSDPKESNNNDKLYIVLDLFDRFLKRWHYNVKSNLFVTKGSRVKKINNHDTGLEEVKYKHSYHVIYETLLFKNKEEHASFLKAFKSWVSEHEDGEKIEEISDYKILSKRMYNFAYDGAVYTKNRLMRLPGQTKPEADCSPFEIVEELEGYECLLDPIFICGRFATNGKCVMVTLPKDEEFQRLIHMEDPFTPRQKQHYIDTVLPSRDDARCLKDVETMEYFENLKVNQWFEIDGKMLRRRNFNWYFRFLNAVIAIYDPPKERVIQWMNHSLSDKAERNYNFIVSKIDLICRSKHMAFLKRIGLNIDVSSFPTEVYNEYMYEPVWKKGIPEMLCKPMPTFNEVTDFSRLDLNNKSVVELISGIMGSGKTHHAIQLIKKLQSGSKVLYVIGRRKLAEELRKRIKEGLSVKDNVEIVTSPTTYFNEEGTTVHVVVINSLGKVKDNDYDLVVIDEAETTMGNLEMEDVDPFETLDLLGEFVSSLRSKVLIMDAMFSTSTLILTRGMCEMLKHGEECNFPVRLSSPESLQQFQRVGEKKSINALQLVAGPVQSKVIVPLFNDKYTFGKYIEVTDDNTRTPLNYGNAFLLNMMHHVHDQGKKIAVAVPTRVWVDTIVKLFSNKRVLAIQSNSTFNSNIPDFLKYDVVVYTSAISAGHSIDIRNHFYCVYGVISNVNKNAEWVTPPIGEMLQMIGRVRHPISNQIFLTLDTVSRGNTIRKNKFYHPFTNTPYLAMMYNKKMFTNNLSLLSYVEFEYLTIKWITEKAFPKSTVNKDFCLSLTNIKRTIRNSKEQIKHAKQPDKKTEIWGKLRRPNLFYRLGFKNRLECIPQCKDVFEEEEKLTGLKLEHDAIAEDQYVITGIVEPKKGMRTTVVE